MAVQASDSTDKSEVRDPCSTTFGTLGENCLGVMHVPKCGGSAMRTAFAKIQASYSGPHYFDHAHFGSEDLWQAVPAPNASTITEAAELATIVKTHRIVIGHYSAQTLLNAGCHALAVQIREPRSRLLSLYRFWQSQSAEERSSWGRWGHELVSQADHSIDEFLRSSTAWPATDNAIWRQLIGNTIKPNYRVPLKAIRSSAKYRSLRARLYIVEWSQNSEKFLARICELIKSPTIPTLTQENVTTVLGQEQDLTAATHRLLKRRSHLDSQLIAQLIREGLLEQRSASELDEEFERTATRLGFRFA